MKQGITFLSVIALLSLGLFIGFSNTGDQPNGSRSGISSFDTPPVVNINPFSALKFSDSLNGANDTTALKNRGYKPYYRGTGPQGLTATWFQPSAAPPFPAFNGPTTGYAAANFNVVTGTNNIDSWLVLPKLNIATGDTLSFYTNSTGSTWVDSVTVSYSAAGDSVPEAGSWVMLGKFKVNAGWALNNYMAPAGGPNARFAIRYKVVNGGPNGANSDYMGVDMITVRGSVAPPSTGCGVTAGMWAPANTYPDMPLANYFSASAWLGDTLYVQSGGAGVGSTTVYRYTFNGTWSTGVPAPVAAVGASLTAANGRLYLIGGGTAGAITTGSTGVYEYNPSTGAWTTKANLPAALSAHGAANWGDSVIFVVGGPYTGAATNLAVHYYRIASNTWGTIANSLPSGQGRRTFGFGIVNGNKLVMSSGFNTVFLKSTYVGTIGSNASLLTWTAAPDVPTSYSGLSRPGAASFGKYFFLVNGERATLGGYYDTTHIFNGATNTWLPQVISNIPFKRSNIFNQTTAKCINDTVRLFIPAGYGNVVSGGVGAATSTFEVTRAGVLTGINDPVVNTPGEYKLSQNYPNPFNPVTRISFSLPEMSFVTLKVYDITGKEVVTLVNEVRGLGTHEVSFNAANLSSGTYFYKIQTENFTQVKKMVLLK